MLVFFDLKSSDVMVASIHTTFENSQGIEDKSMININDFSLIYLRKSDERKFLVRYVTKLDLILIDSVSGDVLKMSEAKVRRRFRPDKISNKANKKRRPFMNFGKKRIA